LFLDRGLLTTFGHTYLAEFISVSSENHYFVCFSYSSKLFHPKIQILILQHPDVFPKVVYRFMYTKDTQNYIELEIKHHFNKKSPFDPFFMKTFMNNTNSLQAL